MSNFIEGILSSLVATWIDRSISWGSAHGWFGRKRHHIQELQQQLRGMPFIYRDMNLDIGTEFVELETHSLDRGTLMNKKVPTFDHRTTLGKLRDAKRMILLGQAGMGKTTMFRYAIQSILSRSASKALVRPNESILPFFVPLIAIEHGAKSPIVNYLLARNEYFGGISGLNRLEALAADNELMLFLDGYDEVPYAGGTRYIQDELTALFSSPTNLTDTNTLDKRYLSFYKRVSECRIWISSRREFFATFPFLFDRNVSLLSVAEMGTQRIQLVNRIFARYRATGGEFFGDRLNAERFMQQLAAAKDPAIQSLSTSPLFLTVMCYVYVGQLREKMDPEDAWRLGTHSLIGRCLELLLKDIDEYKSLGSTPVEREARMARRSKYVEEKKRLLPYLAARSYLDGVALLDRKYMKETSQTYFGKIDKTSASAEEILAGLDSSDPTINIVEQLIQSNVFVYVERNANDARFNFPHRRFRESLASEYLDSVEGCSLLCEKVEDANFLELILVYVGRSEYGSRVFQAALQKFSEAGDRFHVSRLAEGCLNAMAPVRREQALLFALEHPELLKVLPEWLIDQLIRSPNVVLRLESLFAQSFDSGDMALLSLTFRPLHRASASRLHNLLASSLTRPRARDDFGWNLVSCVMDSQPALLAMVLRWLWADRKPGDSDVADFGRLCFAALHRRSYPEKTQALNAFSDFFGVTAIALAKKWGQSNDLTVSEIEQLDAIVPASLEWPRSARPMIAALWIRNPEPQGQPSGGQLPPAGTSEWLTKILDCVHPLNMATVTLHFSIKRDDPSLKKMLDCIESVLQFRPHESEGEFDLWDVWLNAVARFEVPPRLARLSLQRLTHRYRYYSTLEKLQQTIVEFNDVEAGQAPLYLMQSMHTDEVYMNGKAVLTYDADTHEFALRIEDLRQIQTKEPRRRASLRSSAGRGWYFRIKPAIRGPYQLESISIALPPSGQVIQLSEFQMDAKLKPSANELFAYVSLPKDELTLASLVTKHSERS